VALPDDIMTEAEATGKDVLLAVAMQFYADNRLTYAGAVRLAGVSQEQFDRELVRRGISVAIYPPGPADRRWAG
jgi:predicted HTH domain antitoxin